MNIFKRKVVEFEPTDKIKEGYLKKESRIRKVWKERWCVLTSKYLYTFESQGVYVNPTEQIEMDKVKTIKTDSTKTNGFFFVIINII